MSEMYVCFIPCVSGELTSKCKPSFTLSSGTAKQWAQEYEYLGATYHTIQLSDALPVD